MGRSKDNGTVSSAFSEVSSNPPKIVQSTAKKYGPQRARKQTVAIALSKARKAGANLPNPKLSKGGRTF